MTFNEYLPLPPGTGVLAMTRLRNRIRALDAGLETHLRNIRVNGRLQGCSGFVVNPATSKIAYVSTDTNHGTRTGEALYRSAESLRDFTGGVNRFADYDSLPGEIVELLR